MNYILKSGILNMIGKQYGKPKSMAADCITQEMVIVNYDNTKRTDRAGFTDKLPQVAKMYGFKQIHKIAIEFELKIIVLKGIDLNDKPKTIKF